MSIPALKWAFRLKLTGPLKAVLIALADHADDENICFPSTDRLALWAGVVERTVRREILHLMKLGLVRKEGRDYALNVGAALPDSGPIVRNPDSHAPEPRTNTPAARTNTPEIRTNTPAHNDEPPRTPIEPPTRARAPHLALVHPPPQPPLLGAASGEPDGFPAFWDAYPKKVGKGAARKAYAKALQRASPEIILAGVKAAAWDTRDEGRFIPHAATWLNGDRWDDQRMPPTAPRAPKLARTTDDWETGQVVGGLG